jgi:hypothetical protein
VEVISARKFMELELSGLQIIIRRYGLIWALNRGEFEGFFFIEN